MKYSRSIALLWLVLLAGCSSPQTRIQERPDVYSALPKKFQEAAAGGEVVEGMNADAVYIALGHPSRVLRGVEKGVKRETWIYTRLESQDVPAWRVVPGRIVNGRPLFYDEYDPISVTREQDAFLVKFENGRVVGWQQL